MKQYSFLQEAVGHVVAATIGALTALTAKKMPNSES